MKYLYLSLLVSGVLLVQAPSARPDGPGQPNLIVPGILHEEMVTTQRPAKAMRPLKTATEREALSDKTGAESVSPDLLVDAHNHQAARNDENLLHQMDVYALSPYSHFLAMPRMVSPVFVMEAKQGRAHLPTQTQWDEIIDHCSRISGLDPRLISAVIKVESNNNPQAISPKGAQGLMQLMPATQAYLGVTDPFDPQANVQAGSMYLQEQLATFGSVELALAAYNAGPGNVHRYGGIPPFNETRNFIRRVLDIYQQ